MSLSQLDRELLGESSSDENAAPEEATNYNAPGEDEDSDSPLSESFSIATEDAFPFADLSTVAVGAEEPEVAAPPEITPGQAARISARPRRALRSARIPAQSSTVTGGSLPVSQPPPIPQQLPLPLDNAKESPRSATPEPSAEPPKDKGKGKGKEVASANGQPLTAEEDEGVRRLTEAQLRHLQERFLPGHRYEVLLELQANFDTELATEASRVEEDATRRVGEFIAAQYDNAQFVRAEAVVSGERLQQLQLQLSQRDQYALRLQSELEAVQRDRDQALHAIVQERAMRGEQASVASQREERAHQQIEEIREELSREKVTNDNLRQSLADCQAGQKTQPPADDCAARLRDLEARLKQEHAKALEAQAERMLAEGQKAAEVWAGKEKAWWWKQAEAFRAEKDGEVARATARAEEERRGAEKAIAGLKKELEARPASNEAESKIQSLEGQGKELAGEKRALAGQLYRSRKDCEVYSATVSALEPELRRTRRKVEEGERKWRDLAGTVRSLRTDNQTLDSDRTALDNLVRSKHAELMTAYADLSEERTRNGQLATELQQSALRFAGSERRAWEVAREAGVREGRARGMEASMALEVEGWLDGRLGRWRSWEEARVVEEEEEEEVEEETGEKEMDSLLGVPEEAIEGPLRPQFPNWRAFWLLVCFFLFGLVVALSASSAESALWFGGGAEVTWGVQLPGDILGSVWEDPFLDLSRGMYGG